MSEEKRKSLGFPLNLGSIISAASNLALRKSQEIKKSIDALEELESSIKETARQNEDFRQHPLASKLYDSVRNLLIIEEGISEGKRFKIYDKDGKYEGDYEPERRKDISED